MKDEKKRYHIDPGDKKEGLYEKLSDNSILEVIVTIVLLVIMIFIFVKFEFF